jgi:hypothetical protein
MVCGSCHAMHPEALTGHRGARSICNFGRILSDRIACPEGFARGESRANNFMSALEGRTKSAPLVFCRLVTAKRKGPLKTQQPFFFSAAALALSTQARPSANFFLLADAAPSWGPHPSYATSSSGHWCTFVARNTAVGGFRRELLIQSLCYRGLLTAVDPLQQAKLIAHRAHARVVQNDRYDFCL